MLRGLVPVGSVASQHRTSSSRGLVDVQSLRMNQSSSRNTKLKEQGRCGWRTRETFERDSLHGIFLCLADHPRRQRAILGWVWTALGAEWKTGERLAMHPYVPRQRGNRSFHFSQNAGNQHCAITEIIRRICRDLARKILLYSSTK